MSEVKPELKQCSRCHSNCTLENYDKNRKGEWFKLCNNCRGKGQGWRDNNKDKIQQYNNTYITKHNPLIECSNCKCPVRFQIIQDHHKGYQCNVFGMDPKPDFHEWLFENHSNIEGSIERIEKGNHNIISWKNKANGTSSAVSDDRLKEVLNDNDCKDKIEYIWNWKKGPNSKIQI